MANADEDDPERYQPATIRKRGAFKGFRRVEQLQEQYTLNYRQEFFIADINDGHVIRRAASPCCSNLAAHHIIACC